MRINTKTLTALMILLAALLSLVKEVYETNRVPYNAQTLEDQTSLSFEASVLRVIDGDTVEIGYEDKKETVRLIGVDAPEFGPHAKSECFGEEASHYMKEIAEGRAVKVVTDPTQDEHDMYGRLLAYIYLDRGTLINQKMIEEGYAEEYTYTNKYNLQSEFKAAESEAKLASRGLWSECYVR